MAELTHGRHEVYLKPNDLKWTITRLSDDKGWLWRCKDVQSAARPDNVNCSAAASRRHAAGAILTLTLPCTAENLVANVSTRSSSNKEFQISTEYDIWESSGGYQYLSRAHRIFAVSALDPGWLGYLCGIISQSLSHHFPPLLTPLPATGWHLAPCNTTR